MPVWVCIEWWHECEGRRLVGINHLMCDYDSAAGGGHLSLSLTHFLCEKPPVTFFFGKQNLSE